MALENGHYAPVLAKKVSHWPLPDANGDGEPVWEDKHDGQGNYLGRDQRRDEQGRVLRHYSAPEGFINIASKDAGGDGITDNYVKTDSRGRVWRHPLTGEAVCIKPGRTVVEHSNGDFQYLDDDFSRYLFEQSHERVTDPGKGDVEKPLTPDEQSREEDEKLRKEFEDWKASKNKEG